MYGVGVAELGILLAIVVIIFLICRELVCWYWKLNKIVYYQEYQKNLLQSILKELRAMNPNAVPGEPSGGDSQDVSSREGERDGGQGRNAMSRAGAPKRRRPRMAIDNLVGK